jgi:hypothetical protein
MIAFIKKIITKIDSDRREYFFKTVIVGAVLATAYIVSGNIFFSLIAGIGLAIIIFDWDSRVFIGFGMFFLLSCPFFLMFMKKTVAEEMAIYAYYLLIAGIIIQIIQSRRLFFAQSKRTSKLPPWLQRRKNIVVAASMMLLAVAFSGMGFFWLYRNINGKIAASNKIISQLANQRTGEILGVRESVAESTVFPEDNQNSSSSFSGIKILLNNKSGNNSLPEKILQNLSLLGATDIYFGVSAASTSQETTIRYCSECLLAVNELLMAMPDSRNIFSRKDDRLSGEIMVDLGTNQVLSTTTDELIPAADE